jgi:hypothetical protein
LHIAQPSPRNSVTRVSRGHLILKGGESSSGQITGIDAQEEALSIQRSGITTTIPLNKIQRVVFKNGALVYRSNGRQIIRGERDRPTGKLVTWSGIPLNTFTIKQFYSGSSCGEAETTRSYHSTIAGYSVSG